MEVLRFQAINVRAVLRPGGAAVIENRLVSIGSGVAAQSAVDTTFWAELQRLKLGELRLSERPLPLQGVHRPGSGPVTDTTLAVALGNLAAYKVASGS